MKNKLLLFFTIITFPLNTLYAQDLTNLKIEAQKIFEATSRLDFDVILEFTYPKVFDIVSKGQMKQALITTFNGTREMKIKLIPIAPEFIFGEIKKINNQYFCLIDHNIAMQHIYSTENKNSDLIIDVLKENMNTKSVTYDKDKNTFSIVSRSTMIAIYDEFTDNTWKFLNKDKDNVLFEKIFDKKIKKELGL